MIAADVPWRSISVFRNIMVHDYLGLDLDVIWSVVSQELLSLEVALSKIKGFN
jgi:uncharacterized protein with HEPN domain